LSLWLINLVILLLAGAVLFSCLTWKGEGPHDLFSTGTFFLFPAVRSIHWLVLVRVEKIKRACPGRKNRSNKSSVVIPVRDEERNIEACLLCIIQQNYPDDKVEIIVSDDQSTDQNRKIVRAVIQKFSSRRILFLRNDNQTNGTLYKKQAIASAVEQATGELIVTTDADCTMSVHWLTAIVSHYEKNTRI